MSRIKANELIPVARGASGTPGGGTVPHTEGTGAKTLCKLWHICVTPEKLGSTWVGRGSVVGGELDDWQKADHSKHRLGGIGVYLKSRRKCPRVLRRVMAYPDLNF